MNDDTVRQGALADQRHTQTRIEALRAEIAEHEEHLTRVTDFIAAYDWYSANAAQLEARAPAYAS